MAHHSMKLRACSSISYRQRAMIQDHSLDERRFVTFGHASVKETRFQAFP
jgi:hypothetical protein